MSRNFTKLFSSITTSTIWVSPDAHLRLWVFLLAEADPKGRVWGSIPGVASAARIPLADAEAALQAFMSPDPYSRTKDAEGRRIEEIDGGWRLLNYIKYRELQDDEARQEYKRKWDREKRGHPTKSDSNPTPIRQNRTQEEEEFKTLRPSGDDHDGFGLFWTAYPRKVKRKRALQAWAKLKPDAKLLQTMLNAIEVQKRSQDWMKDGGSFIPHPTSWLNDRRWEDEQGMARIPVRRVAL